MEKNIRTILLLSMYCTIMSSKLIFIQFFLGCPPNCTILVGKCSARLLALGLCLAMLRIMESSSDDSSEVMEMGIISPDEGGIAEKFVIRYGNSIIISF